MPVLHWELARDQSGSLIVTIIKNFQQIAILLRRDAGDAQVINDQQRHSSQLLEELGKAAVGPCDLKGAEELGSVVVEGSMSQYAGVMTQGAR